MRNVKRAILNLFALLFVATALFTITGAANAKAASDLTGVWTCDDGGTYYLRQVSSTLWWYGEQDPDSPAWSNVARGTISGNTITLSWVDVTKGSNRGKGTLKLKIISDNELQATSHPGFGGSVWNR